MNPAVPLRAYTPADRAAFHALLRDESLAGEFAEMIASGELDDPLAHPVLLKDGMWLVEDAGVLVGFGMLLVMPSAHGAWSHVRLGVLASHRRRGVGTALLRRAEAALAGLPPGRAPRIVTISAWLPAETAPGFLERHGFAPFRNWWTMERPAGPVPAPVWPDGIRVAPFDGTDHALREWADCYNEAFAARFPSHLCTVEEVRQRAAGPHFRADGLRMAWDGERLAGFCRLGLTDGHSEVDVLAVRPDAQGRGLGRALLRAGVDWLQRERAPHVRLLVDGENDGALRLYRSEGFQVARTRGMWSRAAGIPGRATGSAPPSESP